MVLSDKFGGKPQPNLVKQTLFYVLSFGLGALLIVGVLSFTFVTIADSLLPGSETKSAANESDEDGEATKGKRPSKSRRGRGSEGDGEEL